VLKRGNLRKFNSISFITPSFNEAQGIAACVDAVLHLHEMHFPHATLEHIIIDNGSEDGTQDILRELSKKHKHLKLIINTRNFGIANSPYHAFMQSSGEVVVPIVADLQTPLEIVPKMLDKWSQGYDIVTAIRVTKELKGLRHLLQKYYYKMLSSISNSDVLEDFIGFGVFDKKIVQILKQLDDPAPYFRGAITNLGHKRAKVSYHEPNRLHGKSRQSILDKFELASLGITSSTSRPLLMCMLIGIAIGLASVIIGLVQVILKILFWDFYELGIAPLIIFVCFFSGVQIFFLGLLGIYIDHILKIVRRYPLVFEAERINFE
jgi:glycosyltransferase involved in cell wall biosynthesis